MTDLGLVGIVSAGNYAAGTTYNKGQFVLYQGSSWLCKLDNTTGITPASGANWQLLANGIKGLKNNAETSEAGYALDARMGPEIVAMIPPVHFAYITLPFATGDTKLHLNSNTRHVFFFSANSCHGILNVLCVSTGGVSVYNECGNVANTIEWDISNTNEIKLTKSATGAFDITIMTMRGASPTVVEGE